ncbi:formate dehydrogenase subunit gamma [Caballeronia glathei]|jgi:formate dehydrogenase subunit gamma|uniref:Formate dehydrogenase n=1 Tax=Caballeronia glathei TaxID=60547 RepID=A0A069PLN4_9BURK|nr:MULTISPECIES: formate dehydrogenase subunit gamma [Burkholderiaceae]KDR41525.1 formate dehydrogenase [Caballeronia glathei]TCK38781.1 formate dehydrogenase subunit gamma [Paraburkholderia sp. BL8N3]
MKHDDLNHELRDVKGNRLIVRYTPNERTNHWITAITFVLLALSGLAMFHPAMSFLYFVLGGGQWTRILHPFVGVVMFLSFLILMLRFWHHNYLDKDDMQWMKQVGDVLNNREDRLPEIGRYNAGQKVLFFVMVACLLLLLVSGIVIWRRYFSFYFPIGIIRLASVVHAIAAWLLIIGIVVHIYAAIWVKGSVGAMVRGTVTYGWARKHHPRWFREIIGK